MLRPGPDKVERIKNSLNRAMRSTPNFARPAVSRWWPMTGWGHLQLDATALYLLQLAQLQGRLVWFRATTNGISADLVYYVGPGPTGGHYALERGDKGNHGEPSGTPASIGLVKGGPGGPRWGSNSMAPTATAAAVCTSPGRRMRLAALQALPAAGVGEQRSDSACLSVIGYPAGPWKIPCWSNAPGTKIRRSSAAGTATNAFRRDGHQDRWWKTTIRLHLPRRRNWPSSKQSSAKWPLFLRL